MECSGRTNSSSIQKGTVLKKKILVAFGTRPEIIKLAPVIHELRRSALEVISVHTGQHDELAQDMLKLFQIVPDFDLKSMHSTADLFELTEFLLPKLKKLFISEKPNAVVVQGDTASAYLSALTAFYLKIPVYHVEAGLRSFDNYNPFPEEINRKQISALASIHFAPTQISRDNLIAENIDPKTIFITGNTVIDALYQIKSSAEYSSSKPSVIEEITDDQLLIVVTSHRRENLGTPLRSILNALIKILDRDPNRVIVYPAHPNPSVQELVNSDEFKHDRLKIISPLGYLAFHHLLEKADLILTDSGGLQEEAVALGKKMLVLRDTTERQELIVSGFTKLVGADEKKIITETEKALSSPAKIDIPNPYGDGDSSKKITEIILNRS